MQVEVSTDQVKTLKKKKKFIILRFTMKLQKRQPLLPLAGNI